MAMAMALILPIAVCAMGLVIGAVFHGAAMAGHAFQIDRNTQHQWIGPFEFQRQFDRVAVVQRPCQSKEHDMQPPPFEIDGAVGGQRDAILQLDHLHHAFGGLHMGVQFHPFGNIRAGRQNAVIGLGRVDDSHEGRPRNGHRAGGAGVGVVHLYLGDGEAGQKRKRPRHE